MPAILFPVDKDDLAYLRGQWDELLSFYASEKARKDDLFQMLRERHSEKSRFYHNLSHVKVLLNLCESFHHRIREPHAIRFSIWFHDVVYNTRRDDNEEESARLASEILDTLHVNIEIREFVRDLILATKGHHGDNLSEDAKLFLDMDLAILGASEETYQKYSQAIRAEYSWVPELVYRENRRRILENFINREGIYFTNEMKKRFETQARKNIHDEIKVLETQQKI